MRRILLGLVTGLLLLTAVGAAYAGPHGYGHSFGHGHYGHDYSGHGYNSHGYSGHAHYAVPYVSPGFGLSAYGYGLNAGYYSPAPTYAPAYASPAYVVPTLASTSTSASGAIITIITTDPLASTSAAGELIWVPPPLSLRTVRC